MPTLADDRDEIRDVLARYCLYIDTGAVDAWAELFTEDGVFAGVADTPMVGREALAKFAESIAPRGLHHVVSNEVIEVDGDKAACRASVLVFSNRSVVTSGRYEDDLVRVDGSWRLARRTFTPD